VIMACELYCCLLPQCEALRICRSGFPIATVGLTDLGKTTKQIKRIGVQTKSADVQTRLIETPS